MQPQVNQLDFSGQNIYVGFDVHLKSWQVTVMTELLTHKTFSQPPKPEVLHQYLRQNFPGGTYHSAYEAGFCGYWIHNRLEALGIHSIVVNPADIPTTDKEKVQKEDSRDSRKIAHSLRSGALIPIYVPSSKTLEDRCLVRTRSILTKDLARYKNRVKSFLYFHGIELPAPFTKKQSHWSKPFVDWLESIAMAEQSSKTALQAMILEAKHLRASVLQLTRHLLELSKTGTYQEAIALLRSIPGIGLLTAMTLLTELETINRFKNTDQLCSFIGLIPSTHSSGEKELAGTITRRGHSVLRSALIESAWVAARLDPALTKSFHEYCRRMEPNKAIVRIARKLLNRIRYVLINKQEYECAVVK
ncbi:IS110 family transposase [Solitalea lacus]|uniref:IS110 family transposase n=1 Tax=Solitalea lacus TaxID=2911172 RepID=UPI001EDBEF66|nr:IS110 family transposase [Solitalea lacus]UKJ05966.1 IS110 family transposase [Solitalea lacus]UKJ06075.1 IS110 family transposase [Solitalea lacus]UKJ06237.1 IS110 family transposase [Solitalea lacus]UKJ06458.1 IS110 family transposase [Solitalea lacus]UKJ06539.1 IS110 family transposase [Solitalea lacus]